MSGMISAAMQKLLQDCKIKNIELTRANEDLKNEVKQLKIQIAELESQKVQLPPQQSLEIMIRWMIDEELSKRLSDFTAP
jgi:cell division protein FtsB